MSQMDDAEIIAAMAKGTVEGLTAPLPEFLRKLLGPAAKELGLTLKDEVRFFRFQRRQRLLARAQEMFEKAQKEPEPLPPKLIIPILENGSLEEDDELQDRWAALLVNSSPSRVMPAAPEILRQLTALDVFLLQLCFDYLHKEQTKAFEKTSLYYISSQDLSQIIENWKDRLPKKFGESYGRPPSGRYGPRLFWGLTLDNVVRLRLLKETLDFRDRKVSHAMTELGL